MSESSSDPKIARAIRIAAARNAARGEIERRLDVDTIATKVRLHEAKAATGRASSPPQPRSQARPPRDTPRYDTPLFRACLAEHGLPLPMFEYQFALPRKWAMDIAWPDAGVFMEVQGGLFTGGGHNRGAYMLKEYEKLREAAARGWRYIPCTPDDYVLDEVLLPVKRAMEVTRTETT
jgi:hypothetical protein